MARRKKSPAKTETDDSDGQETRVARRKTRGEEDRKRSGGQLR